MILTIARMISLRDQTFKLKGTNLAEV